MVIWLFFKNSLTTNIFGKQKIIQKISDTEWLCFCNNFYHTDVESTTRGHFVPFIDICTVELGHTGNVKMMQMATVILSVCLTVWY